MTKNIEPFAFENFSNFDFNISEEKTIDDIKFEELYIKFLNSSEEDVKLEVIPQDKKFPEEIVEPNDDIIISEKIYQNNILEAKQTGYEEGYNKGVVAGKEIANAEFDRLKVNSEKEIISTSKIIDNKLNDLYNNLDKRGLENLQAILKLSKCISKKLYPNNHDDNKIEDRISFFISSIRPHILKHGKVEFMVHPNMSKTCEEILKNLKIPKKRGKDSLTINTNKNFEENQIEIYFDDGFIKFSDEELFKEIDEKYSKLSNLYDLNNKIHLEGEQEKGMETKHIEPNSESQENINKVNNNILNNIL